MLVLEFPPRITQIHDLRFKQYILSSDKIFNQFINKYIFMFVRASRLWKDNYPDFEDYKNELKSILLKRINEWEGKSSLGTFLFASLKYNTSNPIAGNWQKIDTITNSSDLDFEKYMKQSYSKSDFYEKFNNVELDSQELIVYEYLNLVKIYNGLFRKINKFNKLGFLKFCKDNNYNHKLIDYETVKRSLAFKIITQTMPDRKDLLLKFDLVKLRK